MQPVADLSGDVLGKLGAASRTEAVARARQLSLIP
jgi:ATP/maltotriose-dependent transcriptional regulator MalT